MKLINHVLKHKGNSEIWSIGPEAPVYEALKMMADKNVGALMVMQGGKVAGVISERDYARKIILLGKSSKETLVREIMTSPVIYTTPNETIEHCMALMTAKHIRHLLVMNDEKLVGIISMGDLVKAIIGSQKELIRQLENYIEENISLT
jgi:CBS domain-containing protein